MESCKKQKAIIWGSFFKGYFYMTGVLPWISICLWFILITDCNQFALIEFYENFHPE